MADFVIGLFLLISPDGSVAWDAAHFPTHAECLREGETVVSQFEEQDLEVRYSCVDAHRIGSNSV